MKICGMRIVISGLLMTCGQAQTVDSKNTFNAFLGFLKESKVEQAAKSVFCKAGDSAASIERVKNLIDRSRDGRVRSLVVVENLEIGNIAGLIVKDVPRELVRKPDYDGILMVKRDGEWKVVLNHVVFEDDAELLDAKERQALSEIRLWQRQTMKTLKESANR